MREDVQLLLAHPEHRRAYPVGVRTGGAEHGEAQPRVEIEGLSQVSSLETNMIEARHGEHDGAKPITAALYREASRQAARRPGSSGITPAAARVVGH